MYSLMSSRMRAFSLSKRNSASALASSVFPTPVGPMKMKLPSGRFGSCTPARALLTASETALTASSWPMILECSSCSILSSLALSPSSIRETGMPVQRETTSAMCPGVISSVSMAPFSCIAASFALASAAAFSTSLRVPYRISATFCRSPALWAAASRTLSSSALRASSLLSSMRSFSPRQRTSSSL